MIAAAGLGSRLGRGHPKCLLDFHGQSILERQLRLLDGIRDVRVVVGFEEAQVMEAALAVRQDIVFVRNAAYRSTNTLQSYALGARGLQDGCLFMDADILFQPASFRSFLAACTTREPRVAVTAAKTTDAVFAQVENGQVWRFSRTGRSAFEWANLCWLPSNYCEEGEGAVFERLSKDLPLKAHTIESFEIDTPEDHQMALSHAKFLLTS